MKLAVFAYTRAGCRTAGRVCRALPEAERCCYAPPRLEAPGFAALDAGVYGEAFANMDPYFLETLREAAANIESFHRQQVHKNFVINEKPGIVLGQKYTPIEKAGVYVPGGTAAYPSTVLMDVIPAKVAGVSEIVMTTPAGKDGRVNPVILAAAATAGVTKICKTGGAQAVAALA